jgi:hypothetical protein
MAMTIIPGLTTTVHEAIPRFVDDLSRSDVRTIAMFPTVIDRATREGLYADLERIGGLRIPHVHLRTDFDENEIDYLSRRFGTEVFNTHPQASAHPFGPIPERLASRVFVENVGVPPEISDLEAVGGICPDFSHLEAARHLGMTEYVALVEDQLARFPIGCCHVSAIREGVPNEWNGGWDHHRYADLSDLDYLLRYRSMLPSRWVSLELENPLEEQLCAISYLNSLLGVRGATPTATG